MGEVVILGCVLVAGPGDMARDLSLVAAEIAVGGEGDLQFDELARLKGALGWLYDELVPAGEALPGGVEG